MLIPCLTFLKQTLESFGLSALSPPDLPDPTYARFQWQYHAKPHVLTCTPYRESIFHEKLCCSLAYDTNPRTVLL